MTRLALLALPLLAACAAPGPDGQEGSLPPTLDGLFRPAAEEPAVPAPLPPQVLAALPAGVPPSVVVRNVDGCYLLSVEVTTPPSGYPLRDAAGNVVCDAGSTPSVATTGFGAPPPPATGDASTLVPGSITPPAPLAPLNPA